MEESGVFLHAKKKPLLVTVYSIWKHLHVVVHVKPAYHADTEEFQHS